MPIIGLFVGLTKLGNCLIEYAICTSYMLPGSKVDNVPSLKASSNDL